MKGTIAFYDRDDPLFDNYTRLLTNRQSTQAGVRDQTLAQYLRKELDCTVQRMGVTQPGNSCEDMVSLAQRLESISAEEATAIANTGDINLGNGSKRAYIDSLWAKIKELEEKKQKIEDALTDVDPLVGGILNADPITIANIRDAHADENWLEFQFNSEKYRRSSSYSRRYSQFSSSRVRGWFYRRRSSYYSSTSQQTYASDMSQSSMNVKGKLLRVHIKRPWFKPEIFDDRNLVFVSCVNVFLLNIIIDFVSCCCCFQIGNTESGGTLLGSPGKGLYSEIDFINKINGDANKGDTMYQLPEYVTSFLLARDIELEFSDVNSRTFRDTVSTFTHSSAYASFFCFSASFSSSSSSNYNSRSSVHRTANGMKIKMPGAQIIGYYTQILPKFPPAP